MNEIQKLDKDLYSKNPYRRFHQVIFDYTPRLDLELRKILEEIFKTRMDLNDWGYIERLNEFWEVKINYSLNEIWDEIKTRTNIFTDRSSVLEKLSKIPTLIKKARMELDQSSWKKSFKWDNQQIHLTHLKLFMENPPAPGDAFFTICKIDYSKSEPVYEYENITVTENDEGRDIINITPPKELDPDDHMGHQLRDMLGKDTTTISLVGRVSIGRWNLPVYKKDSNGDFCITIEKILFELGGCPFGHKQRENAISFRNCSGGYDNQNRNCDCTSNWCPGRNRIIEAGTLQVLARKVQHIQKIGNGSNLLEHIKILEG